MKCRRVPMLLLVLLVSCGAACEQTSFSLESPQATFRTYQTATADDDLAVALRCATPESRRGVTRSNTRTAFLIASSVPEKKEEIRELVQAHGADLDKIAEIVRDAAREANEKPSLDKLVDRFTIP